MQHGEIGQIIKDGKQVGGFLDWVLEVSIIETTSDKRRSYTTQSVKATAKRYWLNEPVSQGRYDCIFYQRVGNELIALFQNELKVKITDSIVDKYINNLEMES
jgi:hypothetical protein